MKKQYISPACEVVKVQVGTLLEAISVGANGDLNGNEIVDTDGGYMDDIGGGGSSHNDFWGD